MLKIGPYREIYQAHETQFLSLGYSPKESAALAQTVVARPLPVITQEQQAAYFEKSLPQAHDLLESIFDGVSLKVADAVSMNSQMFRDADDPSFCESVVNGVYPGHPGMVIVHNITGCGWYAADWTMSESGDVTISNARDIGTYYDTLAIAVTEAILPALDLLEQDRLLPLEIEQAFLVATMRGTSFTAPKVQVDGNRPVEEMEFVKYLRSSKVMTEAMSASQIMPAGVVAPEISMGDAVARLAMVRRKICQFENQFFQAKLCLARPTFGAAMNDSASAIQCVIVAKDKYSKQEAVALAQQNGWGASIVEANDSYRFEVIDPAKCANGSLHTFVMKDGVDAVICRLKSSAKTEQKLFEAGDYSTMGGHSVYVDQDDAAAGDMSGVEKQMGAHNRFRSKLSDAEFQKSSSAGWGQGESHSKDAGNGYSVNVNLHAGKAHTTVTHRGQIQKTIGTATSGPMLDDHIQQGMDAASSLPPIVGYESASVA